MSRLSTRLRMFAGPNGSGKTTIHGVIPSNLLGITVNPDEIELKIRHEGFLDFADYEINVSPQETLSFFAASSFLKQANLSDEVKDLHCVDNKLIFDKVKMNSYFASVLSDLIRNKLLELKKTFTVETVMSSPDKVDLLGKAQEMGYRTYLYYVATEDPAINISRVANRVKMGGYDVPEDKIISRYSRSLDLLMPAVRATNRAYIFDNSGPEHIWLAEITDGLSLEMKSDVMPQWFKLALWDKFEKLAVVL